MFITLTVTDNNGMFGSLTKTIPNPFLQSSPPSGTTGGAVGALGTTVIFAGHDQLVYSGEEVTLQAEIYNDIKVKSYTWQRVGGTLNKQVTLSNANAKTATFTADTLSTGDADIIHTFLLTITDKDNIYTDNIRIIVRDISLKPLTAYIGLDKTVDQNTVVQLDGSESHIPNDAIVTYTWAILENPWIEITNANQISASFTSPRVVSTYNELYRTLTAQLTITDQNDNRSVDSINIDVRRQALVGNAPVARISPETLTILSGEQVTLSGLNSVDLNDNGNIISYIWERIGGTGNDVVLNGITTDTLTFTAPTLTNRDIPINYIIRLIIEDSNNNTDDAQISVNIVPPSLTVTPVTLNANAGINQYVI